MPKGSHPELSRPRPQFLLLACAALVLSVSMWMFFDHILGPGQVRHAALENTPRGNLSDLYPRWLGARELLEHGRDPYSPEMTRAIQRGYYGREIDPTRRGDPHDQQGFAYPLYVVFLLAPSIGLPFAVVREIFNVLFWGLTAGSVFLWLRVLQWRPPWVLTATFVGFTLGSLPVVQAIKLQQLTLVVAALLAAAAAAVVADHLVLAGFLLALATVKPQLAALPALWLALWSFCDWPRRQRWFWSFSASMAALLLAAQALSPGWLGRFVVALSDYHHYTHNQSLLGTLLNPLAGELIAAALVVVSFVAGRRFLALAPDSPAWGAAFSLILALTVVVIPMTAPYNQVLLLPGVLALSRYFWEFRCAGRWLRAAWNIVFGLLFWPWLASLALLLAALVLPRERVEESWKLVFLALFVLPLAVWLLLLVGLTGNRLQALAGPSPSLPNRTAAG